MLRSVYVTRLTYSLLRVQDPRVLDAMLPYMTCYYGNPHSRTHAYGWESEAATEKARQVSSLLLVWVGSSIRVM